MTIFSIVRIVEPGACCSHPVGRHEVYFFAPYTPCMVGVLPYLQMNEPIPVLRGRTLEQARTQAHQLCDTFNNCRWSDEGYRYAVEEVDDESPDRAPLEPR